MKRELTLDEWYVEAFKIFQSMPDNATILQIRNRIEKKIGPRPI